jgi:hypothetical protein
MPLTENATTGDLLAEITRLESQITILSTQLDSHNEIISVLKQTLTERDTRILELESNLVITPKFLLQNSLDKIQLCKTQLINGIDAKIINPLLTQIRQQIQFIQHLTDESKDLVAKLTQAIRHHVESTLAVVNKSPQKAQFYFEQSLVNPALSRLHDIIELVNRTIQTCRTVINEKIISPGTAFFQHGTESLLGLPAQSQILFQVWVLEPAVLQIRKMTELSQQAATHSQVELQKLWMSLIEFINQSLATIEEKIKTSSFWDGKRNSDVLA